MRLPERPLGPRPPFFTGSRKAELAELVLELEAFTGSRSPELKPRLDFHRAGAGVKLELATEG